MCQINHINTNDIYLYSGVPNEECNPKCTISNLSVFFFQLSHTTAVTLFSVIVHNMSIILNNVIFNTLS